MAQGARCGRRARVQFVALMMMLTMASLALRPAVPSGAADTPGMHTGWPQFQVPVALPFDPDHPWLAPKAADVAIADVTGDGRNDVLMSTANDGYHPELAARIYVYAQQPDGSLRRAADYAIPDDSGATYGYGLQVLDYDRDGLVDVVVASWKGVFLYRQLPGGTLDAPLLVVDYPAADLRVVDFDGDGRWDIVASVEGKRISVLMGTDSGFQVFVLHQADANGPWVKGFGVGEFTGDGQPDVVALLDMFFLPVIRVYSRQPDGTWATVMHVSLGRSITVGGFAVGDVTGDQRDDILFTKWFQPGMFVLPMPPAGPSGPFEFHKTGPSNTVAVADVNRDRWNDVVLDLGVMFRNPGGGLRPEWAHVRDDPVDRLAVGDVNSDGLPDVVRATGNLSIAYHTADPVPWVVETQPSYGEGGVALTARPTLRLARRLDPRSLNDGTVRFSLGKTFTYDPAGGTLTIHPYAPLFPNVDYTLGFTREVRDASGTSAPQDFSVSMTADADPRDPFDGLRPGVRFSGGNRYETAAALAEDLGAATTAVIARGDSPFDALAGTYLAGAKYAPVLLTDPHALPAATLGALQRLGVKNVMLLGGEQAISREVEQRLAASYAVTRIAGVDRYDTAARIARSGGPGGEIAFRACAILATGKQPFDALSAGSIAAGKPCPLLLTSPDQLPKTTFDALRAVAPAGTIVVAGGAQAVSDAVLKQLTDTGFFPVRVSGDDRYETAAALARYALDWARLGPVGEGRPVGVALARGDDAGGGIDALGLAAYAGIRQAPVLLVAPTALPEASRAWLERYRGAVSLVYLAGGTQAVAPEVASAARAAITPPAPPG